MGLLIRLLPPDAISITNPLGLNVISFNKGNGLSITSAPSLPRTTGNIMRGNNMHNNGKLGIDLDNNGNTPNDEDDGDTGSNDLMNYPEGIVYYSPRFNETILSGNVNTQAPDSTLIDIYANKNINPSGFGEGQRFIESIVPDSINGSFIGAFAGNIFGFDYSGDGLYPHFTATATGKDGSTSEFSPEFMHVIPPTASAGQYQRAAENQTVFLNGTNSTSAPGSFISSYSWQQIDENGQPLIGKIIDSNKPLAKFVAPEVNEPTVLFFKLTVTDNKGAIDIDTVPVLVLKASTTPICVDNDLDSICDEVDTEQYSHSNDFADLSLGGTTNGTITGRGTQILMVREEPNPGGVRIMDLADFAPINGDISNRVSRTPEPASFSGCHGAVNFSTLPGDQVILTCGSADIEILKHNSTYL